MDAASGEGTGGHVRWALRLFGGFELTRIGGGEKAGSPGKRERVLLACLALSPNSRQPRRKLATLLWGDGDDETALDNLRTTIWRLRKALGDTEHRLIASDGEDVALDSTAVEVDALAFRRLAAQREPRELELAANLYAGELFYGLDIENEEFEAWRRAEAGCYREQAVDVLTRLMQHFEELGVRERAIETGIRILQLEPLNEVVVRRLMRLYAGNGRRGAAVQLYRTLADALRADLDAEPEAETRSVHAKIARGGEERTAAPAGADAKPLPRPTTVTRPSDLSSALGPTKRGMRGGVAAVALAALVVLVFLIQFPPRTGGPADFPPAGAVSVAVLPFVNLSGDEGQDFLSDGMTEEITAALAKVAGLRVVARTSAFLFKNQKGDIQTIARQLHATHLIEGSVRKAGERLRVTAQLVEASAGTHLWSESYDRELTDIFVIQEDIARTIAASLRVPLGLERGEYLVANRDIDADSYQQYLRAKALVQTRGLQPLTDATTLLEQAVARHPHYAPAWALLALGYTSTVTYHPGFYSGSVEDLRQLAQASLPKAERAAREAIRLDPNLADGYAALGRTLIPSAKLLLADDALSKALALDPNNPNALHYASLLLMAGGHLKESLAMRQRLQALEPFVPAFTRNSALVLAYNGQTEAAISMVKNVPGQAPDRAIYLTSIYGLAGRYQEAADAVLEVPTDTVTKEQVEFAAHLLRTLPAPASISQTLPSLGSLTSVYATVGVPSEVLDYLEGNLQAGYSNLPMMTLVWRPLVTPLRKTERFKSFARNAGLVEYWRAKGWPEFCRPATGDDFECN